MAWHPLCLYPVCSRPGTLGRQGLQTRIQLPRDQDRGPGSAGGPHDSLIIRRTNVSFLFLICRLCGSYFESSIYRRLIFPIIPALIPISHMAVMTSNFCTGVMGFERYVRFKVLNSVFIQYVSLLIADFFLDLDVSISVHMSIQIPQLDNHEQLRLLPGRYRPLSCHFLFPKILRAGYCQVESLTHVFLLTFLPLSGLFLSRWKRPFKAFKTFSERIYQNSPKRGCIFNH